MSSIDVSNGNATAAESAPAKVLFIVTGATYWVLKDGTRYATGYWAEEFANPGPNDACAVRQGGL